MFLTDDLNYKQMLLKPAWPCVKQSMPPKCNNWFCPLWQQELQVLIQLHCRWFSAKTCLGHQKHLSLILDFDLPTPLVLVCFETFRGDYGGFFGLLSCCNSSEQSSPEPPHYHHRIWLKLGSHFLNSVLVLR